MARHSAGPSLKMRGLAAVLLVLVASTCASAVLSNAVTEWLNEARNTARLIKLNNGVAIAHYAYVAVAIYRAIQAGGAPEQALAAFAGHTISAQQFPVIQHNFDKLLKAQLKGYTKAQVDAARRIAVPIADALLTERVADPAFSWKPFTPSPPGLYIYQFTPNQTFAQTPQLADSIPFVWPAAKLRAFTSNKEPKNGIVFEPAKTVADQAAVVQAGAKESKTRTKYQTDTAHFWALGSGSGKPSAAISGIWLEIAEKVLPSTLSLKDTALFFARATTALYDAYVACWQVKYRTNYWRPITGIRAGWPGFKAVPDWTPLLKTPPFPEYPSGHQCSAGAVLKVLQLTLGKDKVTFTVSSDERPDLGPRTYTSLQQAADEGAVSRLYAGLHFPSGNKDGQELGKAVGEYVFNNFLKSPAASSRAALKPATRE